MRILDLFAGELGWSRVFAARGHHCVAVDIKRPSIEIPERVSFVLQDVLALTQDDLKAWMIDAIVASSPCEQFSVHGMKHFHPNPPYPELGLKLFNHTRELCEASGLPYIMENVRSAQQFVGNAVHHAGPYYLWGSAVPALMPCGINKGLGDMSTKHYHANLDKISPHIRASKTATIPPELANCVCDYFERLLA